MRSVALLMLLSVAIAVPATGESPGFPRLGDHTFVPVMAITEPFLLTYVQTTLGLGKTVNSTIPVFSVLDSTVIGSVEADQVLTGVGFLYQQRVRDWLVVRVDLEVVGRLGTDTSSLLSEGVTAALNYEFGWMMRIYSSHSVLVSGSIGLGSSNATFISVLDWAKALQQGLDTDLVRARRSLVGSGGLHAAWGIGPRFGLLGSLQASYGESFDGRGDNNWYSDARVGLSYDIAQDLNVPLGLALTGGRNENDANADAESGTWFWNLRFAVQGRSDFSIGFEVGSSYFDSQSQGNRQQFADVAINMRYYY
jgi:hypothetical protein